MAAPLPRNASISAQGHENFNYWYGPGIDPSRSIVGPLSLGGIPQHAQNGRDRPMAQRFNPAPGWPVPPEGWLPPEGWTPDPSWPPAPEGWPFVVDDSSSAQQWQQVGAVAVPSADAGKAPRPWFKKKRFILPIGALLLIPAINALGGDPETPEAAQVTTNDQPAESEAAEPPAEDEETAPSATAAEQAAAEAEAAAAAEAEAEAAAEAEAEAQAAAQAEADAEAAAEPDMTPGQANAVRSAEDYLSFMGFSRQGLIDQLSSEYGSGYSVEDATFAVDHLEVDWNEQAVTSAASYLDTMPFSRAGLIDQLSSEHGSQYTVEQATAAVDGIEVDWNEQAAMAADNYLDTMAFSRQGLIDQLSSEYGSQFTLEQATYGVDQAGL